MTDETIRIPNAWNIYMHNRTLPSITSLDDLELRLLLWVVTLNYVLHVHSTVSILLFDNT